MYNMFSIWFQTTSMRFILTFFSSYSCLLLLPSKLHLVVILFLCLKRKAIFIQTDKICVSDATSEYNMLSQLRQHCVSHQEARLLEIGTAIVHSQASGECECEGIDLNALWMKVGKWNWCNYREKVQNKAELQAVQFNSWTIDGMRDREKV